MRRGLDIVGRFLWGIVGVVVFAAVMLTILYTQTDWGRNRVLAFGLNQLASRVHGYVSITRLHGNLLTGARLDDVVITDSARRPFLRADTLALRYSLRSLFAQHLVLSDVRLVHGTVILDKPPHEDWNFARIFPTTPKKPHQKPGFGSWILIEDMTVRGSTFLVRNEWAPADSLRGAARDSAIAGALSPTNRQWIVPVPGGWQSLAVFGDVDAQLPLMRLADPDSATRLIDIARLSTIAFPFRPPAALVRDLRARVVITKDSLLFDSMGVVLPGTRAGGRGGYALNGAGAHVELVLRPVSFPDVRFLFPDAPIGGGRAGLAFNSHRGRVHVIGSHMDLRAEGAVVTGLVDFQRGRDYFRVGPSDVAFANVDTRLIRRLAPDLPIKVAGSFDGVARLAGVPVAMRTRAWTRFRELGGPTSVVFADGTVGSGREGLTAHGLQLRFDPLYLSVVRGYAPRVPYRGRITGAATLTGSTAQGFALDANLVDEDPSAGRSHLLANGRVLPGNGMTARDLHLRFDPLQVALLRPLVPRLPYGGTITGNTTLNGSTRTRMDLAANLVHRSAATGRSHVLANGGIQIAGGFAARDLRLRFAPLQVAVLRPFEPRLPYAGTLTGSTALTGSPGRGFDVVADVTHVGPRYGRSHVTANGFVRLAGGLRARDLRLGFDPLQVDAIKAFAPDVPYGGVLTGTTRLTGSAASGFDLVANLTHVDPDIGRSHVTADGFVRMEGGFRARGLKLGFAPLQVEAIKPFTPSLPYGGVLTGNTTLTGSPATGFDLVADLTHVDPGIGRSHVTADGFVRVSGGLAARDLRLELQPLQLAAVRPFAPDLRLSGTLLGHANVTASAENKRVVAVLDLEHTGPSGYSHVLGRANADWHSPGFFDVDLHAPALSLATVGAFAPSAGLRGAASGDIAARGNLAHLTTDLNLAMTNGGAFALRGAFDLASAEKRYDFTSSFSDFNAGAVTSHAPATSLSGSLVARGVGTNPATANATLDANLVDSRAAGSPRVDTALVQARLADGLATFERGRVRLGSTLADVRGSFGLVAGRSGTLAYYLSVDSIGQYISHLPTDTGTVRPRPVLVERRIAQARVDSARVASQTEVQRLAVGYPPPPTLQPDTLPLRRDTLAGSLVAQGTATGNIKRFDAQGTAAARNFTAGSTRIGAGSATYTLRGYGTPTPFVHLVAFADTLETGGFAFDSARALLDYNALTARGRGTADVALYQDPRRDYRVRSDFDLSLPQRRLALNTLLLRFDTTSWTATHPSTIRWGGPGVVVSGLDLRSNTGGYLRADGRLPTSGAADLRVDAEGIQLGDITALLQDTATIQGVMGLHARLQGTTRAPVIAGTAGLMRASWGGKPFPDVRATVNYANTQLNGNAQFFQGPMLLAMADARLPINLALAGVNGPRLLPDRPLSADVRADSLPLEAVPNLSSAISDVSGRVRGNLSVRGTFRRSSVNGLALLDLGTLRVNSTGVLYNDIVGTVRLRGDSAYVDSLVAHNGGTVRVTGSIGLADLSRPGFNLLIASSGATLLDNKYGRVSANTRLTAKGPYNGMTVAGIATVTSGVIYAPDMNARHATNLDDPTLSGALAASGARPNVLPPRSPFLSNLVVDVALRVDPDTWVRNSQANFEIYTPPDDEPLQVHMDNPHQSLTLLGTIDSDRGEFTYSGRVFQLSTGSATFMGGPNLDPLLQASAVYTVERRGQEALPIQVDLSGTLNSPRVTLQSNAQPPLSQSDLLGYLAFGQPASSLFSLQGSPTLTPGGSGTFGGVPALLEQQTASLAFGALVDQTVRDIEEQGTRAGLDVFRVHPGEMPAEAAFQGGFQNFLTGTEIEAGKYLSPRLFAEVRGRTSTFPGVSIQYRERSGFIWTATWEPRYLPREPSFASSVAARRRSLGTFLIWSRRF